MTDYTAIKQQYSLFSEALRLYVLLEVGESHSDEASYEDLDLILNKLNPGEIKWELEQLMIENPTTTLQLVNKTFIYSLENDHELEFIRMALKEEGIYWEQNNLDERQNILVKLINKIEEVYINIQHIIDENQGIIQPEPRPEETSEDHYIFPTWAMKILIQYHEKFNGQIFEKMSLDDFLNVFKVNGESKINFCKDFQKHFNYSLSKLEKVDGRKVDNFENWYNLKIGGHYKRNKMRPKWRMDIADEIDAFFKHQMKLNES